MKIHEVMLLLKRVWKISVCLEGMDRSGDEWRRKI